MYHSHTDFEGTPGPADLDALRYLQEENLELKHSLAGCNEKYTNLLLEYNHTKNENEVLKL